MDAIEECKNKMKTDSSKVEFNLDVVLNNLKGTLREEIQLEPIDDNVTWFRFYESLQTTSPFDPAKK
jgi:hypothetical protein